MNAYTGIYIIALGNQGVFFFRCPPELVTGLSTLFVVPDQISQLHKSLSTSHALVGFFIVRHVTHVVPLPGRGEFQILFLIALFAGNGDLYVRVAEVFQVLHSGTVDGGGTRSRWRAFLKLKFTSVWIRGINWLHTTTKNYYN